MAGALQALNRSHTYADADWLSAVCSSGELYIRISSLPGRSLLFLASKSAVLASVESIGYSVGLLCMHPCCSCPIDCFIYRRPPSLTNLQSLYKRLDACDGPSEYQTVDITLTFICLGYEQVRNMSSNPVLVADSIAAEDLLKTVWALAQENLSKTILGDLHPGVDQCPIAVLSFDHRYHLRRCFTFVLQSADLSCSQNTVRSICNCVR